MYTRLLKALRRLIGLGGGAVANAAAAVTENAAQRRDREAEVFEPPTSESRGTS